MMGVKTTSLLMALLLVTSSFAKPAQSPEPVKVEGGLLKDTVEDGLTIYRGIPYAAPPVGDLRWRAPQPAPKWQGVRAANEYGRACMQSNSGNLSLSIV
jgi:para-nitrobenzyl esterase